jgi:hypothetical protein
MFSIGDYVFNKKTGQLGQVVGYGHQILDSVYTTTLKVLVSQPEDAGKRKEVAEDLYSAWQACPAGN